MKKTILFTVITAAMAMCWEPLYDSDYQTISIGGTEFKNLPIDLNGNGKFRPYPGVQPKDYNGDGLFDLVTSVFDKGAIMLSLNTGEVGAPQFESYEFLQHNNNVRFVENL